MKNTVLIDLDGTLCDTRHRAHLVDHAREGGADWRAYSLACAHDTLISGVAALIPLIYVVGLRIWIASGRDEAAEGLTRAWLLETGLLMFVDKVILRKDGDRRDNVTIKLEIADQCAADGWPVLLAVDDYPKVVDAFLARGIRALLVARDGVQQPVWEPSL